MFFFLWFATQLTETCSIEETTPNPKKGDGALQHDSLASFVGGGEWCTFFHLNLKSFQQKFIFLGGQCHNQCPRNHDPLSQIHLCFYCFPLHFFHEALRLHLYSLHKRLGQGTPSLTTGKVNWSDTSWMCCWKISGENSPVEVVKFIIPNFGLKFKGFFRSKRWLCGMSEPSTVWYEWCKCKLCDFASLRYGYCLMVKHI